MVQREGIRPPKFADKFALLDFDASPMPAISLYPVPQRLALNELVIDLCGMDCKPQRVRWSDLDSVEHISVMAPLVCQIFNWSEVVEWGGVRFTDVLDHLGLTIGDEEFFSFHSSDGVYFETLPASIARDPRVLLARSLNGRPLQHANGGPLRLVVPFLQGYKSVKWLGSIRVTKHDPIGIKRLLGQSVTGRLGKAWLDYYGFESEEDVAKTTI